MSTETLVFIGLIFAAVFLLSQSLIVPVFGESRQTRKRLKKRLGDIEQEVGQQSISSLLREKYLRELAPWERTLERLPAMESLSAFIEQAGGSMLAYRLTALAGILAVCGGIVAWVFSSMWVAALAGAAVGGALPFLKIARDRGQRMHKIEEDLPEAVDMMKRALRAGHPFSGAIKLVGEEMTGALAKEFKTTFADLNYGNDVRRAMLGLLKRVPSVPMMAFVTSVLVQKETGGNLAEILEQISTVIRGRFRLERKIRTLSAEGRMSTWVLAAVPVVLFIVISLTTPGYLPVLTEDEFGRQLLVYAVISAMVGAIWIRRIIRIDV